MEERERGKLVKRGRDAVWKERCEDQTEREKEKGNEGS